jgi:hypothetical protein
MVRSVRRRGLEELWAPSDGGNWWWWAAVAGFFAVDLFGVMNGNLGRVGGSLCGAEVRFMTWHLGCGITPTPPLSLSTSIHDDVWTWTLSKMVKLTLASVLLGLFPVAWAGMYGQPVVNLDSKTFKKVMATEHAAVGHTTGTTTNPRWSRLSRRGVGIARTSGQSTPPRLSRSPR